MELSRRQTLAVLAAGAGTAVGGVEALLEDGKTGSLRGGEMALAEEYNVAGNLYIGPDSAKSDVAADSGRVFLASDTQIIYHGDSGNWVKEGVGSSTEPVPSVTTEDLTNNGFDPTRDVPEDPRSYTDDFEDGTISGMWATWGTTTPSESGGSISVTGSDSNDNGFNSIVRYAGRVTLRAVVNIPSTSGRADQAEIGLSRGYGSASAKVDQNGGAAIFIDVDNGGVDANYAPEGGSFQTNQSLSGSQATTGTDYTVEITIGPDDGTISYMVEGNSALNYAQQSFSDGDFTGPFCAHFIENEASFDVKEVQIQGEYGIDPRLQPSAIYETVRRPHITDRPFSDAQPKEAGGIEVGDSYYLLAACWDSYSSPGDKDVVLLKGSNPVSGPRQVSKVTDDGSVDYHASGIAYDVEADGKLWLTVNDSTNQDTYLYSADEANIPSSPSGWTDHGIIIDDSLDPTSIRQVDDTWYVGFQNKDGSATNNDIEVMSGPDLRNLTNRRSVLSGAADGFGVTQGVDMFPDGRGGWLLTGTWSYDGTPAEYAAQASSIDDSYTAIGDDRPSIFATPGLIYDTVADDPSTSWYGDHVAHFRMLKDETSEGLAEWNGHYVMHFEAGDGNEFRVGSALVPKNRLGDIPQLVKSSDI